MLQLCELDRGPGEELVAFVIEMPELHPLVVGWANFFRTDVRKSKPPESTFRIKSFISSLFRMQESRNLAFLKSPKGGASRPSGVFAPS